MNISDIPKLTYCPSNGCHVDLDALPDVLERWGKSYGIDLNPEFQRDHAWSEEIQVKFLEYLFKGGIIPPLRFNGPSFGGDRHEKWSNLPETVVLVDGKQRYTAIKKFMDGELAIFDGNFLKDFDDPKLLLRKANVTYVVNKLQTKRELYKWYLEMNEGQVAHTSAELEKVRKLIAGI